MDQYITRSVRILLRSLGLILLTIVVNLRAYAVTKANGEAIYNKNCAVCHQEGKVGAPKLGDIPSWKPILEQGLDKVFRNVHSGPHGRFKNTSTSELKEAVKYMANKSVEHGNYTLW